MLAYMRHIDKGYYAKFIEVHKIDSKLLPAEDK